MTPDDDLEIRPSPSPESDPLDQVLIHRTEDLFPPIRPDRRPAAEPAESRPLFAAEDMVAPAEEERAAPDLVAPAGARAKAFGIDALLCAIVATGAFLGAAAEFQRAPSTVSWMWCAAFAAELSLFLCVPCLVLFGRTPGMALADLTVEGPAGEKPPVSAAFRRWALGLLTVLFAGLPLLTLLFDRRRRTPADLASGWHLRVSPESLI